ncbi:MAG: hypothetical protein QOH21_2143, partial [Acidobacteriota bacterium]|nr:hypothetical protein [Acidobacteriota bacterium]
MTRIWFVVPLLFLLAVSAVAQGKDDEGEETRADEMPVLTAKSIVVTPAYPRPGEPAAAVLTIESSGGGPAKDVEVVFYANGDILDSRTVTIGMPGMVTVSVPWMAKSAGTTTLVAKIDPRQQLLERDRYDNTYVLDVVASEAPPVEADFAVTAIDVLTPAEGPGAIRVVVGNEGKIAASAPLIIRRNGAPVTVVDTGVIEAGHSATIEVQWSDPDRGKLSAEVNPRWAGAEASSKNNTLAAPAAAEGVDLRIDQLAFHALADEGERTRRIVIDFRIVNDGAEDVTKPFRTRIDPGAVDPKGQLVPAYVTTDALPAGGTVYVSHIFESAPDELEVTAVADADDAVKEADEKNNVEAKVVRNIDRWVNIGPRRITAGTFNAIGRLSTMAIHPTQPSTMYVGAQLSGVWKTTDGGATWLSVAASATVRVAALALEPGNPSRVFLVTPNDGVFRSNDGGTSWTQISTQDLAAKIHAGGGLLINPGTPAQMVVSSERGIFRSTDGGMTWTQTLMGGACTSLVRMPANGLLYAALRHDTDATIAGIYESFDWGLNWRPLRGCPSGPLPSADRNANIRLAASGSRLYVTYQQAGDPVTFRLFRTTNLGCNVGGQGDFVFEAGWQGPGADSKFLWSGIWADPTNSANVYMTGTDFWRSTNSGSSFTRSAASSGNPHSDHHQVATDPVMPSKIYTLTDGGIYRSTNRGASGSWVFLGDGITNVEFYDGVAAPTNAGLMIGGTQDNGTLKATSGNAVWAQIKGGDGATVDIDPTNPSIMYAMDQYVNSVARSSDGGGSFTLTTNGLIGGNQCANVHFQVHPSRPTTLFLSCLGVWRTLDSASNWALNFVPAQSHNALRTAIDGSADTVYAGTNAGEIFMAPGGGSWRSIYEHPSRLVLTDLEINLADPARLYASFDGSGAGRIIRLVRSS